MKYQIEITGMHCMGCSNLIKMSLEEEGFSDSDVDIKTNLASFESSLRDKEEVKEVLDRIFSGLSGYFYKNIKVI